MCNTKPILVILDAVMESVIGGLANGIHELKKDTIMVGRKTILCQIC